MYSLLFTMLLQPAEFVIRLETNTETVLFLDGERILPGQIYRTQPIIGKQVVEIEIRYLEGAIVRSQVIDMEIVAGRRKTYTIKIESNQKPVMLWGQGKGMAVIGCGKG